MPQLPALLTESFKLDSFCHVALLSSAKLVLTPTFFFQKVFVYCISKNKITYYTNLAIIMNKGNNCYMKNYFVSEELLYDKKTQTISNSFF